MTYFIIGALVLAIALGVHFKKCKNCGEDKIPSEVKNPVKENKPSSVHPTAIISSTGKSYFKSGDLAVLSVSGITEDASYLWSTQGSGKLEGATVNPTIGFNAGNSQGGGSVSCEITREAITTKLSFTYSVTS